MFPQKSVLGLISCYCFRIYQCYEWFLVEYFFPFAISVFWKIKSLFIFFFFWKQRNIFHSFLPPQMLVHAALDLYCSMVKAEFFNNKYWVDNKIIILILKKIIILTSQKPSKIKPWIHALEKIFNTWTSSSSYREIFYDTQDIS